MAGAKGAKLANRSGREMPKKHHCPDHDGICQGIMLMPGRKMRFRCPEGCDFSKGQTVLR